jgi:hypothetical protein
MSPPQSNFMRGFQPWRHPRRNGFAKRLVHISMGDTRWKFSAIIVDSLIPALAVVLGGKEGEDWVRRGAHPTQLFCTKVASVGGPVRLGLALEQPNRARKGVRMLNLGP